MERGYRRCVWGRCWNTALQPSLCFSMSQYMLAFMVPSMNCSSPVPSARTLNLMQPQTMTLPPPCLTVGKTHLSLYSSPGCRHTRLTLGVGEKIDASMHHDSLSNDSGSILRISESILSLVFNQMCDDAEFALETPVFCLLPIPHTHTPLEPSVK